MSGSIENRGPHDSLYIMNDRASFGGAGRYAIQLYSAAKVHSRLFSIIWNRADNRSQYPGELVTIKSRGAPHQRGKLTNYLARSLPRIFFGEFSTELKRFKRGGGRIHYASQLITPFDSDLDDIVTILDLIAYEAPRSQPFNYMLARHYLGFRNILTLSEFIKNKIIEISPDSKPVAIHPYASPEFHPVDKAAAREKLGLPLDRTIVLNISSSQQRKNLSMVRELMKALDGKMTFVRVGARVSNEIVFTDVSDEVLNLLYNSADLFLFPTLNEGLGYPLIEAMAVGVPIVSSDIPVVRETTRNSCTLVDPNDISQILSAIRDTLSSPSEVIRKEAEVSKYYTFERFKRDLLDYYAKIGVI